MFRNLRGVRDLKIATLTTDTLEAIAYDKPVQFAGAREIGNEAEESTATEYYDNQASIVTDAEGADKYKLITSVISDEIRAKIEGRKFDETKGAYFGSPKNKPYVAIGFVGTDTDNVDWYYWIYKTKLTGGNETYKSKDDGTDTTNLEWEASSIYTQHKFEEAEDKPLKFYKMKAGGTVTEQAFFAEVYDPDKTAS